jgi:ankyrin repeat protein
VDACGGLGIAPLSMACRYGHIEMAAMLIDYGANVNFESVRGSVPLIEAARGNHFDLVTMLLSREALVGRKNKHHMTAADWALKSGHRYVLRLCVRVSPLAVRSFELLPNACSAPCVAYVFCPGPWRGN